MLALWRVGLIPVLGVMSSISATWQKILAAEAFDHSAWEFNSRQLAASSKLLNKASAGVSGEVTFESISATASAQLLSALAIELMAKAYYLKSGGRSEDELYTHDVRGLVSGVVSAEQLELLQFCQNFVLWGGRYPTPRMDRAKARAAADVPSQFIGGVEHFDAKDFPNHASPDRYLELEGLFNHLRACWESA
jgi:hypothetical protein